MSREYISERKMRAIRKDGVEIEITVGTGVPYEDSRYEAWACPVKIDGLYEELSDSVGIDSWQSLRLAQKLVVGLLQDFVEKGGKIYLFGEDDEISKSEIEEFF